VTLILIGRLRAQGSRLKEEHRDLSRKDRALKALA
jgi:hypothetical protein